MNMPIQKQLNPDYYFTTAGQKAKDEAIITYTIPLIQKFEGFKPNPYNDVGGKSTIGYGTLVKNADLEQYTDKETGKITITKQVALELVKNHIDKEILPILKKFVKKSVIDGKLLVYPYEFGAILSLAYNIGATACIKSSFFNMFCSQREKVTTNGKIYKDYSLVVLNLLRKCFTAWNKVNGKEFKGLTNRREQEWRTFTNQIDV